jgi:hypothetical protein
MYEWLEKFRENPEEELSMVTVPSSLKLEGVPIFIFSSKRRFLIAVMWVELLLEVVVIHNRLRDMFEPVSFHALLWADNF